MSVVHDPQDPDFEIWVLCGLLEMQFEVLRTQKSHTTQMELQLDHHFAQLLLIHVQTSTTNLPSTYSRFQCFSSLSLAFLRLYVLVDHDSLSGAMALVLLPACLQAARASLSTPLHCPP